MKVTLLYLVPLVKVVLEVERPVMAYPFSTPDFSPM